jgi:hypothetical protein
MEKDAGSTSSKSKKGDNTADETQVNTGSANSFMEKDTEKQLHDEKHSEREGIEQGDHPHYVVTKEGTKGVQYVEGDPENPRNWSKGKKWYLTILCSYINVLVASQASVYSTGQDQIAEEFGISDELAIGGLSLYVLGFAVAPMVVAPLSETFGRRRIYIWCWAIFVLLQFGGAFAPNVPVLFIFRFLTGCFSSPPLANTGGVISDLWARDESGPAMAGELRYGVT